MSSLIGYQQDPDATKKLHSLGYESLIVYREPYGWKVWDKNLSGCQRWDGLKRQASACVSAVKRGVVPQEASHVKQSRSVFLPSSP